MLPASESADPTWKPCISRPDTVPRALWPTIKGGKGIRLTSWQKSLRG